ncbi:MAG: hypothetical protein JKY48_08340 [Flavobacteriales bacterium]|nr:hypothetical protein [Flavobacteriales bacterium]
MKMKWSLVILLFVLISCSNSEEEKRIHLEKIEVGKSLKVDDLNDRLEELKFSLKTEQKSYLKIKKFQLGRSSSTKRKQLSKQRDELERLKVLLEKTEREISMTNLFNSFEFQKTPEGTVLHIFQSAQLGDYSKMRHLLDPYGEYDNEVKEICLIEMQDEEYQGNWNKLFSYGRIMNKLKETDNEANIEIAIGENSSQLIVLSLVKRLDKWYLIEG